MLVPWATARYSKGSYRRQQALSPGFGFLENFRSGVRDMAASFRTLDRQAQASQMRWRGVAAMAAVELATLLQFVSFVVPRVNPGVAPRVVALRRDGPQDLATPGLC